MQPHPLKNTQKRIFLNYWLCNISSDPKCFCFLFFLQMWVWHHELFYIRCPCLASLLLPPLFPQNRHKQVINIMVLFNISSVKIEVTHGIKKWGRVFSSLLEFQTHTCKNHPTTVWLDILLLIVTMTNGCFMSEFDRWDMFQLDFIRYSYIRFNSIVIACHKHRMTE